MITNLPVREGETVVIGIQNSPGSTLMTLADMSVITAEVKVDETDIVNVQLGQPAEVTIDAIPKKIFHGDRDRDRQQRDRALHRRGHIATDVASQEAKDFKVVVTLQDPPTDLRPGLSTTAKITTATRSMLSPSRSRPDHPRARIRFGASRKSAKDRCRQRHRHRRCCIQDKEAR